MDYDPPLRPNVAKVTAGRDGLISFVVTAEAGSRLSVRSNGREVLTARATGGPQTLAFHATTGEHHYRVTAEDAANNTSEVAGFEVVADATPPAVKGAMLEPGDAKNAIAELRLAPGEDVQYTLRLDDKELRKGELPAEMALLQFPVANGNHKVAIELIDRVGNTSTFERDLRVDIPKLEPVINRSTPENTGSQEFRVDGTPGTRGTITVGTVSKEFQLKTPSVVVRLAVPDGEYVNGVVKVRDASGRTGKVALGAFVVDTVRPVVRLTRGDDDSAAGKLAAFIAAEEGAHIVWRILDGEDNVLREGAFVASDAPERIVRDLEEGEYDVEVVAKDGAGNVGQARIPVKVEADPMSPRQWIVALIFLGLVLTLAWLAWRRRGRIREWLANQRHLQEVKTAQRAYDAALAKHGRVLQQHRSAVAQHEAAMGQWTRRKAELEDLLDEAGTYTGKISGSEILLAKLKRGERVYSKSACTLVEQTTRQNVPVLKALDEGRVVVTNLRVIFRGDKSREWPLDKLEQVIPVDPDITLMKVSSRVRNSGIQSGDTERFRLHLELALADYSGRRDQVVDALGQKLKSHARTCPSEPASPPPAPQKPALLVAPEARDSLVV